MIHIHILSPKCGKGRELLDVVEQAAQHLKLEYKIIEHIHYKNIWSFGVYMTPSLALDGIVRLVGIVPSVEQAMKILQSHVMERCSKAALES